MNNHPATLTLPSPPSTSEFLGYYAQKTPQKIAVSWNMQDWSYSQFFNDVTRVTQALEKMGLSPGQFVLVYQANPYYHLLILLACENLRVATASLNQPRPTVLYSKANCIFSATPMDAPIPVHIIDEEWFATTSSKPLDKAPTWASSGADMGDIVRVSRSSGTTGQPKIMRLNRGQVELWIQFHTQGKRLSENAVLMVSYGFEVSAVWGQVIACLRSGGTALWGDLSLMSTRFDITCLWLLPTDLLNLIQKLPGRWKKPAGLLIYTGGAPLSDSLRQQALEHLCHDIINAYATNEAGMICELNGKNVGILKPGLEIKVVDDDGHSLGTGHEGLLAFRSPIMVHEYWDQPEYTEKYFRDGWFYPGDRGKLISPRVLQHLGRNDEMLNFGGIKQPPHLIEQFFLNMTAVMEAAVTSVTGEDGVDILLVALVLNDPAAMPQIQQAAKSNIAPLAKHMRVLSCDKLPKTPNGKIQRMAIRDLLKSVK